MSVRKIEKLTGYRELGIIFKMMALCIYQLWNRSFNIFLLFHFCVFPDKNILHLCFLMHFFPPEDEKEVRISLTLTFFCFKKLRFNSEFANSAQFHWTEIWGVRCKLPCSLLRVFYSLFSTIMEYVV